MKESTLTKTECISAIEKGGEKMQTRNLGYTKAGTVCLQLDITLLTLYRWYKWWDNDKFPKPEGLYLPPYYHKDLRKTKWFKNSDIPDLEKFRDDLRGPYKGAMSEFNAALQWGTRGERALKNKGKTRKDVHDLM